MPILDMTLRTPLPSALMMFLTAFSGSTLDHPAADELLGGLHREVGVDRGGAVADEQRDVVHLAHVAGLDDEADLRAGLLADQVVVHRRGEQQRRDRREVLLESPVGQDDEARTAAIASETSAQIISSARPSPRPPDTS
jgi:hypothetical protein